MVLPFNQRKSSQTSVQDLYQRMSSTVLFVEGITFFVNCLFLHFCFKFVVQSDFCARDGSTLNQRGARLIFPCPGGFSSFCDFCFT